MRFASLFLAFLLPCLVATSSFAGGSIKTDINGLPLHWEGPITYNPDKGGLKNNNPNYDHDHTVKIVQDAFHSWISVLPPVNGVFTTVEGPPIPKTGANDIDTNNFHQFFGVGTDACYDNDPNTECITPIIFDADGEILDSMFGACAKFSILGFAGMDDIEDGSGDPAKTIVKRGQALFSGACIAPAEVKAGCGSCRRLLTDNEVRTIITHEMGHMMGMDHSEVNPNSFLQCLQNLSCSNSFAQDIPTMFPILVDGAEMQDLHEDDVAYFQRLYGDETLNGCSVKGKVFASDGATELRGVEVVARNVDPAHSTLDAIAFVSGAQAPRFNDLSKKQGNCKGDCGRYLITGLTPGESYQLCAQKILPQFSGGSSVEPVDPPFQSFSDVCPQGLTVACDCPQGHACQQFDGKDITTDADPTEIDQGTQEPQIVDPGSQNQTSGGGCSLAVPQRGEPLWPIFVKKIQTVLSLMNSPRLSFRVT